WPRPLVMVGAMAGEIRRHHQHLDVQWHENPAWATTDMFTTLLAAIDMLAATRGETHPVMVWPVDCPFASPELIEQLGAALKDDVLAVVPTDHGQPGQPVALSAWATRVLRAGRWPHLRAWLEAHPDSVTYLQVAEPAVLRNLNEPPD